MSEKLTCGSCVYKNDTGQQIECRRFPPAVIGYPSPSRNIAGQTVMEVKALTVYAVVANEAVACGEHVPAERIAAEANKPKCICNDATKGFGHEPGCPRFKEPEETKTMFSQEE